MFCKNCGKELEDNFMVCPYCGDKIHAEPAKVEKTVYTSKPRARAIPTKNKVLFVVSTLAVIIGVVLFVIIKMQIDGYNTAKSNALTTIRYTDDFLVSGKYEKSDFKSLADKVEYFYRECIDIKVRNNDTKIFVSDIGNIWSISSAYSLSDEADYQPQLDSIVSNRNELAHTCGIEEKSIKQLKQELQDEAKVKYDKLIELLKTKDYKKIFEAGEEYAEKYKSTTSEETFNELINKIKTIADTFADMSGFSTYSEEYSSYIGAQVDMKCGDNIKYIVINTQAYNEVGDEVDSAQQLRITAPSKSANYKWENVWYNSSVYRISIVSVEIEFFDESKLEIPGIFV